MTSQENKEEEIRHLREAKRRAGLAGRSYIATYDFPPCVSAATADEWIRRDAERRSDAALEEAERRRDRLASCSLPFSVCGDFFVASLLWQ